MYRCLQGIYIYFFMPQNLTATNKNTFAGFHTPPFIPFMENKETWTTYSHLFTMPKSSARSLVSFSLAATGDAAGCVIFLEVKPPRRFEVENHLFCIGHGANQFENQKNWRLKAWTTKKKMKTTSATLPARSSKDTHYVCGWSIFCSPSYQFTWRTWG